MSRVGRGRALATSVEPIPSAGSGAERVEDRGERLTGGRRRQSDGCNSRTLALFGAIVRNVLSNWTDFAVSAVIGFFLSPYLVHTLGNEGYGNWTMIVTICGYISLIDLGIPQGVVQFVARYHATEDASRASEVVSSAVLVLSLSAVGGVVASGALAWLYPCYMPMEGTSVLQVQLALLVAGMSASLTPLMEIPTAILAARHNFHLINATGIVVRLLLAGGIVAVLTQGFGLAAMACVTLVAVLLGQLARGFIARRLAPRLLLGLTLIRRSASRELLGYAIWLHVVRIVRMLLSNVDLVLVGFFYGPVGAAYYGIALTLITYAQSAIGGLASVLSPIAIEGDAKAEAWRSRALLIRSSRVGLMLAGVIFIGFVFWGKEFIAKWMGPVYVEGVEFTSAATILVVAAAGRVLAGGLVGPQQTLIAMRQVRTLARITVAQGALATVTACLCAKYWSPLGAAAAASAGAIAAQAAVTVRSCRLTQVTVTQFVSDVVLPSLLGLAIVSLACFGIGLVITGTGWAGIFIKIAATALVALPVGIRLCMRTEERQALLMQVASRLRLTGRAQ
ncbi:MAG: hypothetical protein FJ288_13775 [Planctomycetes bacterium]|nr:hypothetical protein [Planctomycetota bacterium]